ncbi:Acetamidase [Arthrobotrys entomopaga]|nr:Acetamidase [Arthrobotrys entomopaga]
MVLNPWQQIAKERQEYRDASVSRITPPIPEVDTGSLPLSVIDTARSMLTAREVEITEKDSMELINLMSSGDLTAIEVTNAFLRRAGVAQKLVNCITELLPERALSTAKYLDEYYQKHKKPIGPFHGLPMSVKEHIGLKGLTFNAGYCSKANDICPDDNDLVKILSNAGAVFFARTTEPQSLMHLETDSNLYGPTVNPFNRNLTCGGSSGGEGALGALRGSSLGIGSDIGGSIRIPSANNGLYGFKPTQNRLPISYINGVATFEGIQGTLGPISTTLEPLSLFMSTVLASKPWDTDNSLLPIPWRQELNFPVDTATGRTRKMKIGVMRWDGVVMPHPPITRGINEVVAKLREFPEQFEIVEWEQEAADTTLAWETITALWFADGGQGIYQELAKTEEPMLPLTEWIVTLPTVPKQPGLMIQDLWKHKADLAKVQQKWMAKWLAADIDVLLAPVGPGVAPRLQTAKYVSYTCMFNLVEYPAAVFPVSRVDERDLGNWDHTPVGEQDKTNVEQWDANDFMGAPISLQLVGRQYQDEKVLEALNIIHKTLGLPFVDLTH